MTASMMATVMATCSAFMIDAAALFTENIYRPLVAPNKQDDHYLKVARVASVMVTITGFVCGTTMPSVVAATVHFISILPFLGVSFWIGIIWPRANRYGAWISTVGSAMVFFGAKHQGVSNAWASLASLLVGITGMIAGSYIGGPEDPARMNRIFRYLHMPADDGDLLAEAKSE
jgi:Na+/proline symporter